MLSAGACHAARKDLTSLGHELAKSCNILIINLFYAVNAEVANLLMGFTTKRCSLVLFHCNYLLLGYTVLGPLMPSHQNGRSSSPENSVKSLSVALL